MGHGYQGDNLKPLNSARHPGRTTTKRPVAGGRGPSVQALLSLQQTAGNRAVSQLVKRATTGPLNVQRIAFERSSTGKIGGFFNRADTDADRWIAQFAELKKLVLPLAGDRAMAALAKFVRDNDKRDVTAGERDTVGAQIEANLLRAKDLDVSCTSTSLDVVMKPRPGNRVPFAERLGIAIDHLSVSMDQLRPYTEAVSTAERSAASSDATLLALAKSKMSADDYLALLPALGLYTNPTTKIAEADPGSKWMSHMRGDQADIYIRSALSAEVAAGAKAGRKVEGEVSIVDDADWVLAFRRQWGTTLSPTVCNAFVDVSLPKRHIWVHKDRGNAGTVIHEGMHKYADPTLRNDLIAQYPGAMPISQLDEGITEYFTRQVTGPLGIARSNYENPFQVSTKLVARVGRSAVAKGYFDGAYKELTDAYVAKRGSTWAPFAQAIEEQRWSDASKFA